jgi:hypothetical protein
LATMVSERYGCTSMAMPMALRGKPKMSRSRVALSAENERTKRDMRANRQDQALAQTLDHNGIRDLVEGYE